MRIDDNVPGLPYHRIVLLDSEVELSGLFGPDQDMVYDWEVEIDYGIPISRWDLLEVDPFMTNRIDQRVIAIAKAEARG